MRAQRDRTPISTKLIATLGPATADIERLVELIDVGLDVGRLNFSHGDTEQHDRLLSAARTAAGERGAPLCIIGDLSGPKVRLTRCESPFEIATGETVRFMRGDEPCTAARLSTTYARLVDEVDVGHRIYVDDGFVRFLVVEREPDALVCTCTAGGTVASRKGVNLPDSRISAPTLAAKDLRDLDWAIERGLDYVALSFVREPEDLYELKRLIKERSSDLRVIVKIEKTEALQHLDELIANADALLVARGDLGVETDIWRVPLIQKDIVARCQRAGVPVIVATQMLQSMVHSPMPTRAEVSDVANAIFDRADAVMLSAETAVGRYPGQAVDMMNRIAAATEQYLRTSPLPPPSAAAVTYRPTGAVAHAAAQAALNLGARVVAAWTATGATVRMVAKHRLPMPVVGLTFSERVYRQLNLLFGVIPVRVDPMDDANQMATTLDAVLLARNLVLPGDLIVVVTSRRPHTPGATDTTLVHRVGTRPGDS